MNAVISIHNLSKSYCKKVALEDISLDIPQGTILGVLGNNGSGKTTLLKACMGQVRPSNGDITVLGHKPWQERPQLCREVGYIPDIPLLDGWLRIRELLRFMQGVHPHWNQAKTEALFKQSGLDLSQKIATLSKGMREKLYLLLILSIDSRLMILDEPTLGLDIPFRRVYLDRLLTDYFTDERTVVIATHELEEFEQIFDRIIILNHGKVLVYETVEELKARFATVFLTPQQADQIPQEHQYQIGTMMRHGEYLVHAEAVRQMSDVQRKESSLTDIFIGVVEGGLR